MVNIPQFQPGTEVPVKIHPTDHTKVVYYPSEDMVYRLYVCHGCQRYLKTIDLREAKHVILLPAERVTTVAMDAAAQQEGYHS